MDEVAAQQAGIGGIGFGALGDAVAIAAEAVAVDEIDGVAGLVGAHGEFEVVGAGGLEGDGDGAWREGLEPALDVAGLVGDAERRALGVAGDIEVFLADIDTDESRLDGYCHVDSSRLC